jgi:chromosome segregation ATPase
MAVAMRDTWTDERLDDLNTKVDRGFENVDKRFEEVDKRFDKVDQRFDKLEDKIDALAVRMEDRFDTFYRVLLSGTFVMMASLIGLIAVKL